MKRFPIKVILLSLFIVINLTVICTFPTSMSDNDSEEVVNNLVTFLNKNDMTVFPTIINKETKKVSSATLQNFIEDRDAFAKNILGAKKEVTKNGETYTANGNQVIFDGNDLGQMTERELRKARQSMGIIFQQFQLLAQRNGLQNVCFPLELQGMDKKKREEKKQNIINSRKKNRRNY